MSKQWERLRKKLSMPQLILLTTIHVISPLLILLFAWVVLIEPYAVETKNFWTALSLCVAVAVLVGFILLFLDIKYIWNPLRKLNRHMKTYSDVNVEMFPEAHENASEPEELFSKIVVEQKNYMAREYKMEALKKQAELMALQSQINPHFLYNTLDSIRGVALVNDVPEIADMTEALSKLFRSMIANEGMMIPLKEEFQSVDNYMLIQQFRFDNRISYNVIVEEDDLLNYKVPNLIIQPIVENAVIHGLERKEEGGCINISGYATNSRIVISVEDNGVGIEPEKLDELNEFLKQRKFDGNQQRGKSRMGFALLNINERIKLRFGEAYGLAIMSTPEVSTTVEIVLPIL